MTNPFRCPSCNNRIVQKSQEGGTSVRAQGRITIDKSGVCHSSCFHCKAPIVLPLELTKALPEERLVVDVVRRPIVPVPSKA